MKCLNVKLKLKLKLKNKKKTFVILSKAVVIFVKRASVGGVRSKAVLRTKYSNEFHA